MCVCVCCVRELQLCSQAIRSFMLILVIENIADGHKVINAHNGVIARFGFLVWIDNRNPNAIAFFFWNTKKGKTKQNMQRSHWNPSLGFLLPNLSYFGFSCSLCVPPRSSSITTPPLFSNSLCIGAIFRPFQINVHFSACYMVQMIFGKYGLWIHTVWKLDEHHALHCTRAHVKGVCALRP